MSDWKPWFEERKGCYVQDHCNGALAGDSMWENAYQAFKARYQEETYGNRTPEPFDSTPAGSSDIGLVPFRKIPLAEFREMYPEDNMGDVDV
jgi:hypothetical protein